MEVLIIGVALYTPIRFLERGPQLHVGFHVATESGTFCPIVVQGPLADFCEKNIRAGKTVIIFGRFQDDEVLAEDIQIL
jgi:hypothetical protein